LSVRVEQNGVADTVGTHALVAFEETVLHFAKDYLGSIGGIFPIRFYPTMKKDLGRINRLQFAMA
jgi:hypothetical protein